MQKNKKWYFKWSDTLGGGFAGTPEETWNVEKYNPKKHKDENCVFCGLYGLRDFFELWKHKGKKAVWWAGSDIRYLKNGYWLDKKGEIRVPPEETAKWISENCISYVENKIEYEILEELGIKAKIVPSFLGNVNDYKVEFKPGNKVYASVSGDDFKLYKWYLIDEVAKHVPEIEFHLYGNTVPFKTKNKNVIVHGRVEQEVMNKDIKQMQAGLRLIEVEGCSEVIVKSALWGQWPISRISYPCVSKAKTKRELIDSLRDLQNKKEPNLKAREWFLKNLNRYPFNRNI